MSKILAGLGGACLMTGLVIMAMDGSAHERDPLCNGVYDGNRVNVVARTGELVMHGGTKPCPEPEPEPVAVIEPAPEPEPIVITIAGDVAFDFDRSEIKPDFRSKLDEIVVLLKSQPDTWLEVVGHTDSRGSDTYNQRLSEKRAMAVADYLTAAGVRDGRLTVRGDGESTPIATNDSDDGRARNRRVEIRSP